MKLFLFSIAVEYQWAKYSAIYILERYIKDTRAEEEFMQCF